MTIAQGQWAGKKRREIVRAATTQLFQSSQSALSSARKRSGGVWPPVMSASRRRERTDAARRRLTRTERGVALEFCEFICPHVVSAAATYLYVHWKTQYGDMYVYAYIYLGLARLAPWSASLHATPPNFTARAPSAGPEKACGQLSAGWALALACLARDSCSATQIRPEPSTTDHGRSRTRKLR